MNTLRHTLLFVTMVAMGFGCGPAPSSKDSEEGGPSTQKSLLGTAIPAAWNSRLAGVTTGSSARVYFVNAFSQVAELAQQPTGWQYTNLTGSTTAPPPASATPLTAFTVDGGKPRVYFVGTDRHVYELWFSGQSWAFNDLSGLASAPDAAPDSPLTGFALSGTYSRVYYVANDRHVHELAWNGAQWSQGDVSGPANAPNAQGSSPMTGFVVSSNLGRVYYEGTNQHVIELWWDGQHWYSNDLNQQTGAPTVKGTAGMAGFAVNGTLSHVYYVAAPDNHVNELRWDGQTWHASDLTRLTGASVSVDPSALAAFTVNGTDPRVYFYSGGGAPYELWWDGQRWYPRVLFPSIPYPANYKALAGFVVGSSSSHVYSLAGDLYNGGGAVGHVLEFAWQGTDWQSTDLTAVAN